MTATATQPVVPVIDCSAFTSAQAQPERRAETAREINRACEQYGFLVVSGHGVPEETIQAMRDVSMEFFALPVAEKMKVVAPKAANVTRGYVPFESKSHSSELDMPPDLMEKFIVSRFESEQDARDAGLRPGLEEWFSLNVWPLEPPAMQAVWREYFAAASELARRMMGAFAVALDLPETWFEDKIDQHFSNLAANHYPPQLRPPSPGQLRIAGHTDTGSLTLIPQDGLQGGLEIKHPATGTWLSVPSIPGTFVVNIGDLMAQWTNDRWVSTYHRVVNPPHADAHQGRLSLPFFLQPNFDAVVECIPSCRSAERPAKYAPVTSGEWATRVTRAFDPEAAKLPDNGA
jgi:isopenicillin N synthase-like dioxygenase